MQKTLAILALTLLSPLAFGQQPGMMPAARIGGSRAPAPMPAYQKPDPNQRVLTVIAVLGKNDYLVQARAGTAEARNYRATIPANLVDGEIWRGRLVETTATYQYQTSAGTVATVRVLAPSGPTDYVPPPAGRVGRPSDFQ